MHDDVADLAGRAARPVVRAGRRGSARPRHRCPSTGRARCARPGRRRRATPPAGRRSRRCPGRPARRGARRAHRPGRPPRASSPRLGTVSTSPSCTTPGMPTPTAIGSPSSGRDQLGDRGRARPRDPPSASAPCSRACTWCSSSTRPTSMLVPPTSTPATSNEDSAMFSTSWGAGARGGAPCGKGRPMPRQVLAPRPEPPQGSSPRARRPLRRASPSGPVTGSPGRCPPESSLARAVPWPTTCSPGES